MNSFDLNISSKVLDAALAYLAHEMKGAIKEAFRTSMPEFPDFRRNIDAQTKIISDALVRLEGALAQGDSKELRAIAGELKKQKPPDFKNLEKLLATKDDNKPILDALAKLADSISKMQTGKPIKIDEMQMRALTAVPSLSVNGGNMAARNVINTVKAITTLNTEYSYVFPANTVAWTLKLRDLSVLWYYSYTTGTLKVSGDASAYVTAPQQFLQSKDNVDWSGKTIYFEAESSSQVMEIVVYKL